MPSNDLQEQLNKYLTDVHAIERQALAQMRAAPKLSGDDQIAQVFSVHLAETAEHERLISERLNARGASPSALKDIAGVLTGHGFGLFAASQPDTPGKLVVHAFSYEHMEEGTYDMLGTIAVRAGDSATLDVSRQIEAQEHEMGDRLVALFDQAVEVAVAELDSAELDKQLNTYLTDAHAIEGQSLKLLERGVQLAGAPELAQIYRQHLSETEQHQRLVAERLHARGGEPSTLKDAALKLGAFNWGGFFAAQPDTPAKLAVFSYAVEHLEIGAYELLKRVADRADDRETVEMAQRTIDQETDAARSIRSHFSSALDASLSEQGLS